MPQHTIYPFARQTTRHPNRRQCLAGAVLLLPTLGHATRPQPVTVLVTVPVAAQLRAMAAYRPFDTLGLLLTPGDAQSAPLLAEVQAVARAQGVKVLVGSLRQDSAAAVQVRLLKDQGAQWLYLLPDAGMDRLAEAVVLPQATRLGLPSFAATATLLQAGALVGLVVGPVVGQPSGPVGAPLGDLPAPARQRARYLVRLPTARALNLRPPLALLGQADFIDV